MFTSSLAVVTAALLSSVGIVNAGCQNDAVCQQLGCTDNAQVVFGVTEIKEPRTTAPVRELDLLYTDRDYFTNVFVVVLSCLPRPPVMALLCV